MNDSVMTIISVGGGESCAINNFFKIFYVHSYVMRKIHPTRHCIKILPIMFPDPGNLSMVLHLETSAWYYICHACLPNFTDIAEFGRKAAILLMKIRGLKTHNFAWEPGLSDSAHPNYDKKSGSQLFLKMPFDPLCRAFFLKYVTRLLLTAQRPTYQINKSFIFFSFDQLSVDLLTQEILFSKFASFNFGGNGYFAAVATYPYHQTNLIYRLRALQYYIYCT